MTDREQVASNLHAIYKRGQDASLSTEDLLTIGFAVGMLRERPARSVADENDDPALMQAWAAYCDELRGFYQKPTDEMADAFVAAFEFCRAKMPSQIPKTGNGEFHGEATFEVIDGRPQVGRNVLNRFIRGMCGSRYDMWALADSAFYTFNKALRDGREWAGAVQVCPSRDIECGTNRNAWCDSCPKK